MDEQKGKNNYLTDIKARAGRRVGGLLYRIIHFQQFSSNANYQLELTPPSANYIIRLIG